jgi:hypothetical protein
MGAWVLINGTWYNTLRGGPERVYSSIEGPNADTRFSELKTAIENHCYKVTSKTNTTREERDRLIGALLLIADRRYNEYELSLSNESRGGTFTASLVSIGLTSAAALASESAAQTLATLDTGLKGATQAYSKDFLFDQAVPALQNQMRASRATIRERIYQSRSRPIDDWPVCWSLHDLIAYEQAGTLVGAIVDITATSAEEQSEAEEKANATLQNILASCESINSDTAELNLQFRMLVGTAEGANPELRMAAAESLGMTVAAGTVPSWAQLRDAFDQKLCDDTSKTTFLNQLEASMPPAAPPIVAPNPAATTANKPAATR